MSSEKLKISAAVIAGGSIFFVGAIVYTLGLAQWNAQLTPNVPWFPIPVLVVLVVLVMWMERKWSIGLVLPKDMPWGLIAGFAVTSMMAGHCVLILEAVFHGATRAVEPPPEGVSPVFAIFYWLGFAAAVSIASEVAYRGLMQSKLTPLFGVVPAIIMVTFVNTVSHRWDGLEERALFLIAILIAWSVLRHLSRSLVPCILTHFAALVAWDALLRLRGPWDFSQMSSMSISVTALTGLASLAVAFYFARAIPKRT